MRNMQNKKLIWLIVLILILVGFIYYFYPKNQDDRLNSQQGSSETKDQLNKNSSIASNEVNPKVKFEKFNPQLNWKDKKLKINGKEIDYRFGEGNPEEVALNPEDYRAKGDHDGIPYVTPETEKNLNDFLSDSDLPDILDKCENYNRNEMARLNPNIPANQLPILLSSSDFDIENLMKIDPNTGRKEIDLSIINRINDFMNTLSNPMSGDEFAVKCAGTSYLQSIERIKQKFTTLNKSYTNTGGGVLGKEWTR